MFALRNAFRFFTERNIKGADSLCRKIHTTLVRGEVVLDTPESESSLWFTTLPKRSLEEKINKGKRKKNKEPFMPTGPLLISCKREEFNHYVGKSYKKLSVIPLASKGWHSRKANGDYFSIIPRRSNPSFLLPEGFNKRMGRLNGEESDPDEFKSIGISDVVVENLKRIGIKYPTSIQLDSIPVLLQGNHVLMTGETGCGKTLAYALPMLENVLLWKSKFPLEYNAPFGVIVVPTRELAIQTGEMLLSVIEDLNVNVKILTANNTKRFLLNFKEKDLENMDILVSTLGVLCKYTTHGVYSLSRCFHLVLDEADTLLDDSFNEKLLSLLRKCKLRNCDFQHEGALVPKGVQLSLVSATIPRDLENCLGNIVSLDMLVKIKSRFLHRIQPHVKQNFIRCSKSDKASRMLEIAKESSKKRIPVAIFSNKTETCNWIAHFLNENGLKCVRLHSHMANDERVEELMKFRQGAVDIMSCTDIASRGHDIPRIRHVVNYEFPHYMADYVHRSGRTGRIGNEEACEVTSFISSRTEVPLLNDIEMAVRTETELPRVNNNIARLLNYKYSRLT